MIYVDCSQLSRFVRTGKPVSGIQRLTLNSVVGLHELLGEEQVKVLVYDEASSTFRCLSVGGLFSGEKGEPAVFRRDDRVLLMEWYWNQSAFEAGLNAGKSNGTKHRCRSLNVTAFFLFSFELRIINDMRSYSESSGFCGGVQC